jgi:hypothetical protein
MRLNGFDSVLLTKEFNKILTYDIHSPRVRLPQAFELQGPGAS